MKTTSKLTVEIQELHNLKRELVNKSMRQEKVEARIAFVAAALLIMAFFLVI